MPYFNFSLSLRLSVLNNFKCICIIIHTVCPQWESGGHQSHKSESLLLLITRPYIFIVSFFDNYFFVSLLLKGLSFLIGSGSNFVSKSQNFRLCSLSFEYLHETFMLRFGLSYFVND